MTHSVLADYKIARSRLRESPDWELVADKGGHDPTWQVGKARPATAVVLALPTGSARHRLRSHFHRLVGWLKARADDYAAAAAYENLSRLSDAELRHRSLSRDVLARDLGKW
jgi:hypothetical protein